MVRYQYQGTPNTPPPVTVSVISGNVTTPFAGTKSIWLQYRNRAGYSIASSRVQATVAAGQGLSVTIPLAALPTPSGVCIWEYVLLLSNTTSINDACVVATVPGYDSNETTVLPPPFTVTLTEDEHFRLSQIVVNAAALPTTNRKHGMRRFVDADNKIVEWDAIASAWSPVKPQVFNTSVSAIAGTYGANADLSTLDESIVIFPSYSMAANTASVPVGFWLVNDGSQLIEQGTRIGITIENGDADVSYTTGITGGIRLVFRGYVNVATGILDTIGADGITPMADIGVVVPYRGKQTGLTLPKDLASGRAYWIDIYAELTPALLNNRITQGSSLKASVYFYADFATWSPAGGIFGDFIAADGDKRRILPEPGLTAIAGSGSGNLTIDSGGSLSFSNVGAQTVSGFIANQANQSVWIGVDGTCLTATVQPNGTRRRAVVGTVNGTGFATAFQGSVTLNGSTQLRVTVNYLNEVRASYPDVIAGSPATINATFARIYVRPVGGGNILQFEAPLIPGANQVITVGSVAGTNIGTTVPAPASADFGLFTPGTFTLSTVTDGSAFTAGTYAVAIAFRYSNTITSISHSTLNGCIFEAGVSLAEAFDRIRYYGQPVSDLSLVSYADIEPWQTRYDLSVRQRRTFDPTATTGIRPFDRSVSDPGRWVDEFGGILDADAPVADLPALRALPSSGLAAGDQRSVVTPATGSVPGGYMVRTSSAAELGEIIVRPTDNPASLRWIKDADLVHYASAAPTGAPPLRGIVWVATLSTPTRTVLWRSVDTSSVADWVPYGNRSLSGSATPAFTPDFVGQEFIATLSSPARRVVWKSVGTSAATDWVPHDNGAIVGSAAPSFTPDYRGQIYIANLSSPTRSVRWIAQGTANANDWVVVAGRALTSTADPSFTPDYVGQVFITEKTSPTRTIKWISVDTASSSGWVPFGNQVISDAGAPSFAPDFVGQQYDDTSANAIYIAEGTSSSADWVARGGGGGGGGGGVSAAPGIHSRWPLNTTGWNDAQEGRNFASFGTPTVNTDSTGTYTTFDSTTDRLQITAGAPFAMATSTTVWSWLIRYEVRLVTVNNWSDPFPGPVLTSVCNFYRFNDELRFYFLDDIAFDFLVGDLTPGGSSLNGQWITIEAEYKATANTFYGRINGVVTATTGVAHPVLFSTPGVLYIEGDTGAGTMNIRNVEFRKILEIPI